MDLLVLLFFLALITYVLYWTVRFAVRHALEDADERRFAERFDDGDFADEEA